jgi:hypothetical protein
MAQAVHHLPSKREALSSNSTTAKKKFNYAVLTFHSKGQAFSSAS